MNVLILKNIANEGPGTIEEYLSEKGISYQILNMFEPGEMPDIKQFTHLVVMGGPMAVYEMDIYPYLHIETATIRSFIKNSKSVLGVCLGAQVLAYALGAEVYAGGTEEIGWDKVDILPEGMNDHVLSAISVDGQPYAEVFQWHGDTFDLPQKAVRLCSSSAYQNQAFRYRDNVYGLQFHVEVTPEMIREWFAEEKGRNIEDMFEHTDRIYHKYRERAVKFYERFFV